MSVISELTPSSFVEHRPEQAGAPKILSGDHESIPGLIVGQGAEMQQNQGQSASLCILPLLGIASQHTKGSVQFGVELELELAFFPCIYVHTSVHTSLHQLGDPCMC